MKNNKGKVNKKKLIIVILAIIFIIYISCMIYLLIGNGTDTFVVKEGTLYQEESVVGYVIRNEVVIKSNNNGIIPITIEGQKVSKNDSIFQYYNVNQDELKKKINEIDYSLQEKIEKESINIPSEIKLLENQIDAKVEELRDLKDTKLIAEYNEEIQNLLEKKIDFIGSSTNSSTEIKELVQERKTYEDKLKENAEYATAPISGIVSYKVDGLESMLNSNNFDNLSTELLEDINLKTGQIISTSNLEGKVIDNFKYYIATTMKSKQAQQAEVGDKLEIRLSSGDEIDTKIAYIKEEGEKRLIVFELDKMIEKLINYRKLSFDVIWWSHTGLKVPNQAIIQDENGLSYVIRERLGYYSKILVKITKTSENYSIITTFTTSELSELGYTDEDISSYNKIKIYDEILLQPDFKYVE